MSFKGYALLIGVDQHSVPAWSLPSVAKDVAALQERLVHPERCGYEPVNVHTLLGEQARRDAILNELGWLGAQLAADPQATVVESVLVVKNLRQVSEPQPPVVKEEPVRTAKEERNETAAPKQATLGSDFGLYKCEVCGKLVMGFEKDGHIEAVHHGASVHWKKLK